MKDEIVFFTAGKNQFLYSPLSQKFLLFHPLLSFIHSQSGNPKLYRSLVRRIMKAGFITLDGIDTWSASDFQYYSEKYLFLKANGFFKPKPLPRYKGRLTPGKVASNLQRTRQIILEVTEDCNLECKYCAYTNFYENHERSTSPMKEEAAERFIDYILNHKDVSDSTDFIVSFYGGEPLRNMPLIKKIVEKIRKSWPVSGKVKYNMTTNGTLIRKYIQFLTSHEVDIAISLDGDRYANEYRVFKESGKPVYDLVISNLEFIEKNYPEYFSKHVSFLAVLHNRNSYEEVFRFFQQRFGKKPVMSDISLTNLNPRRINEFQETFLKGRKQAISDQVTANEMFTFHPEIKSLADFLASHSGFVYKNGFHLITGASQFAEPERRMPTATCSPFDIRIFLTVDGKILPCEHISRMYQLGSMNDSGINLDDDMVAMQFNSYMDRIRGLCERCYISESCSECMFNTGLLQDPPHCNAFTDQNNYARLLSEKMSMIERDFTVYRKIIQEGYRDG